MNRQETQQRVRKEREGFKNDLKVHCKVNMITQRTIATSLGITDQEFFNMLTGFQNSIPAKGIDSFDQFKSLILEALCLKSL
jgi:hypothetical protein